jgi:hypothetical protein
VTLLAKHGVGLDTKSPSGGVLEYVFVIANAWTPGATGIRVERSVSYTLIDTRIDEFNPGLHLTSDQGGCARRVLARDAALELTRFV